MTLRPNRPMDFKVNCKWSCSLMLTEIGAWTWAVGAGVVWHRKVQEKGQAWGACWVARERALEGAGL